MRNVTSEPVRSPSRFAAPIAGVDFTSRPRRAKPITVALGRAEVGVEGRTVRLEAIETHAGFDTFAR